MDGTRPASRADPGAEASSAVRPVGVAIQTSIVGRSAPSSVSLTAASTARPAALASSGSTLYVVPQHRADVAVPGSSCTTRIGATRCWGLPGQPARTPLMPVRKPSHSAVTCRPMIPILENLCGCFANACGCVSAIHRLPGAPRQGTPEGLHLRIHPHRALR